MSKTEKLLPKKLADCWDVAIKDLKACEKENGYRINMVTWYDKSGYLGTCVVCMAGAVMAQTLSSVTDNIIDEEYRIIDPTDFCIHNSDRLTAINWLRRGFVGAAAREMGKTLEKDIVIPMPEFDANNPKPFYKAAKEMSELLHKLDI